MANRLRFALLAVMLLLITAHRLPAPISEIPESPTPNPKHQPKPKKPRSESRISATAVSEGPARFAGTWTGTFNFGGTRPWWHTSPLLADYTLVINSAGNSVQEKSAQWGSRSYPAIRDGKTVRWQTLGHQRWALTPNPDGKTALVTGTVVSPVIFHRTSP
jgi:hypothetical protein